MMSDDRSKRRDSMEWKESKHYNRRLLCFVLGLTQQLQPRNRISILALIRDCNSNPTRPAIYFRWQTASLYIATRENRWCLTA